MGTIIEFHATDEEAKAIQELCNITGLGDENILRQGLRLYQAVTKGYLMINHTNPIGCGSDE